MGQVGKENQATQLEKGGVGLSSADQQVLQAPPTRTVAQNILANQSV